MNIKWIGSPNYTKGRQGNKVEGVIIHWMDGTLSSADITFQNKTRNTSAHFGVENKTVHQYVKETDTAYQAGNWDVNTRTIGIEHSAQPGRNASSDTMETSAQLIAQLSNKYGFEISEQTVRPHSAIIATACPGTVSVSWLIARANKLKGVATPAPKPVASAPVSNLTTVKVAVDTLYVRSAPTTSAPLSGSKVLKKGNTFKIVRSVQGQSVSGISTWVESQFGNYVWAGGLVGYTTPAPKVTSGTVRILADRLNARSAPNTSAPVMGVFVKGTARYINTTVGQTIKANGKVSNIWLQSLAGNWFSSVWTNYKG